MIAFYPVMSYFRLGLLVFAYLFSAILHGHDANVALFIATGGRCFATFEGRGR